MSTRQAAARFSIGIATAGAWGRLKRSQGDVRPAKQGKPKGSECEKAADCQGDLVCNPATKKCDAVSNQGRVAFSRKCQCASGTSAKRPASPNGE